MPRLLLFTIPFLALPWLLRGQAQTPLKSDAAKNKLRRPVAVALTDEGKRLLVANRDGGSVAVVDLENHRLLSDTEIGQRLSDVAVHAKSGAFLATDEATGELNILGVRGDKVQVRNRIHVGVTPLSVRISPDGRLATVACLWPRRLALVDLKAKNGKVEQIDLPFAPRQQLFAADGGKLIVADAFGGKLAVVDIAKRRLDSVRELEAHNIRGMTIAGDSLLITHQVLHGRGRTTSGEILTSNLITNNVRRFSLAAVLNPLADIFRGERLYSLGDVEKGAGDPAEIATFGDQMVVAISGTDEVHLGRPDVGLWTRLDVGRRPTSLAVDAPKGRAYVANTFADSISVVDFKASKVVAEISLGRPRELTAVERGELDFHDAKLSFEAWLSCNSCHPDGHTNGRLNDNMSDGSFGTPKRVLSLLGAKDTGPWAWNGKVETLESQVRTSLKSTMQGPEPKPGTVNDVAAFVRSLPAAPSLAQARGAIDEQSHKRGEALFQKLKCSNCHAAPVYTTARSFDVGLRDEAGNTHFNPPSLRGLSQAGPFFHDGRARNLREVLTRYNHQLSDTLTDEELSDLLTFLGSL